MTSGQVAAIDLGASSGRVMVGEVGPGRLRLTEVHRFSNDPVELPDGLHWDILRLYHEALEGLRRAERASGPLVSVGIDSWAIDYGLVDAGGRLLGEPYHYRDRRTDGAAATFHALVSQADHYARTGVQSLPFNTIYQLAAARGSPAMAGARWVLLIPDLLAFWLTGEIAAEATNASTTGLFDARSRDWSDELIEVLGLPRAILPVVRRPGDQLGPVRTGVGLADGTVVTQVGSHDTASAVVAVPAEHDRFAYIACGTWALVGLELPEPRLDETARVAGFTNELGVDGRIRFLHNVMGLWLLQESLRTWERSGSPETLGTLLDAAVALPAGGPVIDPDDPRFLPPGDMPARVIEACRDTDQPLPADRPSLVRCILDSLAVAFARTIDKAVQLTGRPVEVVHLVGGGARNTLLCQLTADACRLPVLAGPVEASALGNVLVQARAHGMIQGDLESLRALVRATHPVRRYDAREGSKRES